MKKAILAVVLLGAVGIAQAGPSIIPAGLDIDFRTWTGANGQGTFTSGNVTASTVPSGLTLYQDNIDGLGIRSGEIDEVEKDERLLITISNGINLSGVWITDLFDAPDGGTGETGKVELYDSAAGLIGTYTFDGNLSDQNNGEIYIPFNTNVLVYSAKFTADYRCDNEFSVAGFNVITEPPVLVPVPGALLLGSIGMGFLGFLRKHKSL